MRHTMTLPLTPLPHLVSEILDRCPNTNPEAVVTSRAKYAQTATRGRGACQKAADQLMIGQATIVSLGRNPKRRD